MTRRSPTPDYIIDRTRKRSWVPLIREMMFLAIVAVVVILAAVL